jgi:hypothetical protein
MASNQHSSKSFMILKSSDKSKIKNRLFKLSLYLLVILTAKVSIHLKLKEPMRTGTLTLQRTDQPVIRVNSQILLLEESSNVY